MRLPRPALAVVFDMDGLLVDTEQVYLTAMTRAADEHGRAMSRALFETFVGAPSGTGDRLLREAYGADFPVEAYNASTESLAAEIMACGISLKTGVIELLDELDRRGLPRAIATSSRHATVERHLGWSGLLPRFDAVVAAGYYAKGKPNPDPFLVAAQKLGVAPQDCLALEDSHNGVRAAASAGMMTVMVPDLLQATDEMRGLCIHVVQDLHRVCALIG